MSLSIRFRLLLASRLKIHEEIVPERVEELVAQIQQGGVVEEPILVARGSHVILNGHHRFAALRKLGARKVPAWVVEYGDPAIRLMRWYDGPPLSKDDVVARARAGQPFSPKTTKHVVESPFPPHPTPLAELVAVGGPPRARRRRADARGPTRGD